MRDDTARVMTLSPCPHINLALVNQQLKYNQPHDQRTNHSSKGLYTHINKMENKSPALPLMSPIITVIILSISPPQPQENKMMVSFGFLGGMLRLGRFAAESDDAPRQTKAIRSPEQKMKGRWETLR